jgi:hypothetical protein
VGVVEPSARFVDDRECRARVEISSDDPSREWVTDEPRNLFDRGW